MKPERALTTAPTEPARVEFKVQFSTPRSAQPRPPDGDAPTEPVPPKKPRGRQWGVVPADRPSKAALLLGLAHHWERLVREGVVKDYASIARLAGLTRARVTQIMNLTLLAPAVQNEILFHTVVDPQKQALRGNQTRTLSQIVNWPDQFRRWRGQFRLARS